MRIKLSKPPSFKKFLYRIIRLAKKIGVDDKNIKKIVRVFSIVNPDYKTHYSYIKISEAIKHGVIIDSNVITHCAAKPQYYHQNHEIDCFVTKKMNILQISKAIVYGATSVVSIDDDIAIHEQFHSDDELKYNYDDSVVIRSCFKHHLLLKYKQSSLRIDKGIILSGPFSFNYYHFMVEYLSKLYWLDIAQIPTNIPLIVDEVVERIPQCNELLQLFNADGRKIIFIKDGCSYCVDNLILLPIVNHVPPNYNDIKKINYSDCAFSIESIDYIRNKLLKATNQASKYKKIYLSRKNASGRRRYNEDDVENVFKKHGFEIINPENYSVLDQVAIFNSAEVIAGVTGAAFTNIIFCKEKCKILCIQAIKIDLSIFSTIAKYLNLDFQYYSDSITSCNTNDIHCEFIVDVIGIEKTLIDFMRK